MKKIILLIAVTVLLSCKSKHKKTANSNGVNKNIETPISEALIPNVSRWDRISIKLTRENDLFNNQEIFLMTRVDESKPAYGSFQHVKIESGSTYKLSVIVKRAEIGKGFAMRVQSVYPDRVDAVFNLEKGEVVNTKISGKEFAENIKATIQPMKGGWYKCTLVSDLFSDHIRVVLGPTNANINPAIWETKTLINNNVYIVPSSLKMEEF